MRASCCGRTRLSARRTPWANFEGARTFKGPLSPLNQPGRYLELRLVLSPSVQARPPLKILIADDHPLVAEILAWLVTDDDRMELVSVCADGEAAIEAIPKMQPDVAVLDLHMPHGGPDLADKAANGTKVLFLTGHDDPEMLYRSLVAGARGFLPKTAGRDTIADAIVRVGEGGTAFPREAGDALVAGREGGRERAVLTPQELQVVGLAAEGQSNAEIAQKIFVGQTTVKTHLHNAAEKLGVRGKAATVAEALRRRLIE